MATLVLTSVGSLVGGPIGGAIGAILGQAIDGGVLFKPKGRQGPRLAELAVQTSSYGTSIPGIFGTVRAAGTVIWSTDLREERTRTGGGKGRPSVTNYSYSASFAVLLSARLVTAVRRVWADGNLMRGAAGDWKVATRFRLHRGGEDQPVDPLIAAAEGIGHAPAYRGCAYAVFEDLDLGPYGNRIPSLTFELVADDGTAAVETIVAEVSGGVITAATDRRFVGFASGGDSIRGLLETVMAAVPLAVKEGGAVLSLRAAASPVDVIGDAERVDGPTSRSDGGDAEAPGELTVGYHDPERDYQAGLQRARWTESGRRVERIELSAVLHAGDAKAIANDRLERLWWERGRMRVSLPWRRIDLVPGDCVTVASVAGRWRIAGWTLEDMRVELDLVRERGSESVQSLPASSGRSLSPNDLAHGETRIVLMEPRFPDVRSDAVPQLTVAAAGRQGWRSAALLVSVDGGQSFEPAGSTAAPATIGTVVSRLSAASAALRDDRSVIEVVLNHEAMALSDADDAGLASGRNLAMIGEEMIQFGRAEPLGGQRWRLSRLFRGRMGTEMAIGVHGVGEDFVLLERDTLVTLALPAAAAGGSVVVVASGAGDPIAGIRVDRDAMGSALRPLAPCHLSARRDDAGWLIEWVRRSRTDWTWMDEVDARLGEASERYRLTVTSRTEVRSFEVTEPRWRADLSDAREVVISVQQLGDHGLSAAATLTLKA